MDSPSDPSEVLHALREAAEAIEAGVVALTAHDRSRLTEKRADQYLLDVVSDEIAVPLLLGRGLGVHSEESGVHALDRGVVVVLDPVDGSSNCSRGVPWFGPSLCAVDEFGPLAAVVANIGSGATYWAIRGQGAWRDGIPITSSARVTLDGAFVHADLVDLHLAERVYLRNLGASAHGMCLVADGTFDCYIDVLSHQSPWDHLGASLVVTEAGGVVEVIDGSSGYTPGEETSCRLAVASTHQILEELLELLQLRSDVGP